MLITYCERCKNEVPKPLLTPAHKKEIVECIRANMPLQAMYILKANGYVELKEAKIFVDHLCRTNGKCHRCSYDQLKNEYEVCPKCRSLNINWK
jgi:hypothetical protein